MSHATTPDSSQDVNLHDEEESNNGFDAVLRDTFENDEQGDEDLYSLPDEWAVNDNEVSRLKWIKR